MYQDIHRIKQHTINLRLDDYQYQSVMEYVNQTGGQLAATLRKLALLGLKHKQNHQKAEDS